MVKLKDIPKVERPRERLLERGPDALTKMDLLAILLGSGIKGKNVQKLSQQIIRKFGADFLHMTVEDLQKISGVGQTKALQIVAAVTLIKRYCMEETVREIAIKSPQDVLLITQDMQKKQKEYLVYLYLNAKNVLLKKEISSIGVLDKTLLHPREIFLPAVKLSSAKNHSNSQPSFR